MFKDRFSKTVDFNANTVVDVVDPGAGHTAYVTKVVFLVNTHASGKKLMLRDSAPVTYATVVDQTAGASVPDVHVIDLGKHGMAMTAAKKVQVVSESAGPTAKAHIEGYII